MPRACRVSLIVMPRECRAPLIVMPRACRVSVLRFPVGGRQKPDLRGLLRIPSFGPQRTAGLLTTTVLQPAARDSVATLFRTISSHSEQSPLSFRAPSRNLSRHSTACPAPAAIEPSFHGFVRGICPPTLWRPIVATDVQARKCGNGAATGLLRPCVHNLASNCW